LASSANAASLSGPISGWSKGDVPSTASMYEYVPDSVVSNPPVLVVSHYCGGSASAMFSWASEIVSAADKYGFIIVYPQTSNSCWDVSSDATQARNGGGDSQAIIEMVNYAISKHSANSNRVYAAGLSSGAMMTELLLAVYPDVFKAGSEFSGVPAGCANPFDSEGQCGYGSQTAAQWGDRVRAMYSSYSGYRPRIQLWHGTADTLVRYQNQIEATEEWTNVLGLSTDPTVASTGVSFADHSWDHQSWQNSCGYTVLDVWAEQDGPHNTDAPLNAQYVIPFLGLDQTGSTDPQVAKCSSSASAPALPAVIKNASTSLYLDVSKASTSNGAAVATCTSNGGENQIWQFKSMGSGQYEIISRKSGKCLDVPGMSTTSGQTLQQYDCNGGSNQLWSLQSVNGYVQIVGQGSGKCVQGSSKSSAVFITDCGSSTAQQWTVSVAPSNASLPSSNTVIKNASISRYLDVSRASKSDGAEVLAWSYTGGANQLWSFKSMGDGTYEIISQNSGLCLDVPKSSTTSGTTMQQWSCHGGSNQRFYLYTLGSKIQIVAQGARKCLSSSSQSDGAAVSIQYCSSSTTTQRWSFGQ
jgi:poly(hydroxyalkanoate) depolymerase family esterase